MTKKFLKEAEILKDEQLDEISGGGFKHLRSFDEERYREPYPPRSSDEKAKLDDLRVFRA